MSPPTTDPSEPTLADENPNPGSGSGNNLLMPTANGQAALPTAQADATSNEPMSPGDEAPPGTPGAGENICPRCNGTGRVGEGPCPMCEGIGKVTVGIGGA